LARVKRAVGAHKKRKKVFKLAKGYFGAKSKQYRTAKAAVMKSLNYAYIGRRLKKRDFRKLWIVRINAQARQNGVSYSQMMCGLKKAGVNINRKILADMAVNDKIAFAKLAELAKKSV
jgi:large subunit ribosomal protein L20